MTAALLALSVVEVAVLLGVIVFYLFRVTRALKGFSATLRRVSPGVATIGTQTEAVGPTLEAVNERLDRLAHRLAQAAQDVGGKV